MAIILNLETATTNCSVSLAQDGKLLALREENYQGYSHSEKLHIFIGEVLEEAGKDMQDLSAVAVSKGPGSYTGLRIGVAAAKGICFALDIPLISIPTLDSLGRQIEVEEGYLIPMLDARRMEVYAKVLSNSYETVRETEAEIIDAKSFAEFAKKAPVYLLGNGAKKCIGVLDHPNFHFREDLVPSAREMASMSYHNYANKEFEDLAYFEPYYLKEFILGK
ncbi:tRNA (adenosine(37)-N6)-threonylcarbamoyltransferase complex dimerization subunit type 1 TsaB [Lentiprolixibacter aurantiacus]|uniref:tRNA (Adenosine(37)-N6)-threonylcarbamoyltransferase complex dimerization subunit type 1 TsaB n=1 Tax=Lentiprolixibacter aurantiacus TaxID=2993939 RepID=A0AAE3SN21_9FLAO|nr:tRNA (adenosine(37)-N6)-threonylcarbamoyltransferase complex dimerization subunit type 1 TsaB [Lentiprolixibacter aurantiacus]MCX2719055.1 tRNA (adenosine(37)-N6)-threonylcarbamoyltransferase complex dimerization subunit type 1 TsaB [Lentiprolixibacter aurantiacus]